MITLFVWWTNHLDFSRFIHLSLFTGYIWWTELFNNLQAGMILPAVNDYFCYTLTRSWGDISLNSCIFQTTKSENTFFSKLRYVKLMLSFRCFLFFCFQFVSCAYFVQETILCINYLRKNNRISRRRSWWLPITYIFLIAATNTQSLFFGVTNYIYCTMVKNIIRGPPIVQGVSASRY